MNPFRFHLPTRIAFGPGRRTELSAILPPGDGPALIVTDRNVARHTAAVSTAALLSAVQDYLRDHSPVQGNIGVLGGLFAPYGGPRGFVEGQDVPTRIASYGVREDELELYARKVIIKGDVRITSAPVTVRDIEDIYLAAL